MSDKIISRELYYRPFLSLVKKESMRFVKVLNQTVLTPIITSFLYFLVFGVSLGRSFGEMNDWPYLVFLIPGLVMQTLLNNAFQNASGSIVTAKFTGEIEDYKAMPLSSDIYLGAVCVGALARGYIVSLMIYLSGVVFVWHQHASFFVPEHPIIVFYFLTVGGVIFSLFGVLVSLKATNFDQVTGFTSFIMMPLIFLGGVFFPLSVLPDFWQKVSLFNPILYLINGLRYGFLGQSDVDVLWSGFLSITIACLMFILVRTIYERASFRRW